MSKVYFTPEVKLCLEYKGYHSYFSFYTYREMIDGTWRWFLVLKDHSNDVAKTDVDGQFRVIRDKVTRIRETIKLLIVAGYMKGGSVKVWDVDYSPTLLAEMAKAEWATIEKNLDLWIEHALTSLGVSII